MSNFQRIGGRDVEAWVGTNKIVFDSISLNVELGLKSVTEGGLPAGYVKGQPSADGELKLSVQQFNLIDQIFEGGKSWEDLDPLTLNFRGSAGQENIDVVVYGAKLTPPNLEADTSSDDRLSCTMKFIVTGKKFVEINGRPLLSYN